MAFVLSEWLSVCLALLLLAFIVVGGGALFARFLRFPGFEAGDLWTRAGQALLTGLACLPVLLDLAGRLGPQAMAAAAVLLAGAGLPALWRGRARASVDPVLVALAALWIALASLLPLDWPNEHGLVHATLVIDYVKHAATTWSLAQSGTPPWNPTFFEPGRPAAYYYFFYTLTGSAAWLGAFVGLAGRHAAIAGGVLMGFALVALADALSTLSRADAAVGAAPKHRLRWTVALACATGLDLIPYSIVASALDARLPDAEWWDEQVASFFVSVLWTPHHIAGLCAACVGFIALSARAALTDARNLALGALAFASMAGLSIYVAFGAGVALTLWSIWRLALGQGRDVARLAVMGAGALALAAPWLATIAARAGAGPAPIAFGLRGPDWIENICSTARACNAARALSMPLFYALEFGLYALGAFMFWRKACVRALDDRLTQLLVCATLASFLVGSFLRSTIVLNDLGWRVMLFAQIAMLVWTASAARVGLFENVETRLPARLMLALGYGMVLFTAAQARLDMRQTPLQSATLPDEIAAWAWLDAHLPKGARVQAQPRQGRALSYGLYGRFPTYVADRHNGVLFGARDEQVLARLAETEPLFGNHKAHLAYDDVRRFAERRAISALVVTALDSVFADPDGWTAMAKPDYENAHVRIYLFGDPAK